MNRGRRWLRRLVALAVVVAVVAAVREAMFRRHAAEAPVAPPSEPDPAGVARR